MILLGWGVIKFIIILIMWCGVLNCLFCFVVFSLESIYL